MIDWCPSKTISHHRGKWIEDGLKHDRLVCSKSWGMIDHSKSHNPLKETDIKKNTLKY